MLINTLWLHFYHVVQVVMLSISSLNSIVTALMILLGWNMIRMHLIGKEDTPPSSHEYPFDLIAKEWGGSIRLQKVREQQKERSDKGTKRKHALLSEDVDDDTFNEMGWDGMGWEGWDEMG